MGLYSSVSDLNPFQPLVSLNSMSRFSPPKVLPPKQPTDDVLTSPPSLPRRYTFFQRLQPRRIGRQIGYGYLTAIAVGWIGSITGILIADYFQGKALFQLLDAQEQTRLLIRFEETATQIQLNEIQAIAAVNNPDESQAALTALDRELKDLSDLQARLDTFFASNPSWRVMDESRLKALLAEYSEELSQQQAQTLSTLSNETLSTIFSEVFSTARNQKLNQFSTELADIIRLAQAQETQATVIMESAQGLEKFIVISSVIVAGLVAILMAWRTTRAIAAPIEEITQVARRVTDDVDYDVRARVFKDDEVGTLARSLNELIEQVAERTRSLEEAAQIAIAQNEELEHTLKVLKKAQLQLIQTEKMSSLGQLVAGIAHEINNPIGFIRGNLKYVQEYSDTLFDLNDRLREQYPNNAENIFQDFDEDEIEFIRLDFPKVLQSIRNGTERINSLIVSLKIFSRLQESQLKKSNLNEGLDSALLLLGHRLKPQAKRPEITVVRQYGQLPLVECLSSQMNQVFMNILSNAIDAIEGRWEAATTPWQPTLIITTAADRNNICIKINNNGLPIPDSDRPKIFDPFFTTKALGQGVGLGMSVSYEIICKKHHGEITFTSPIADEMGTEFCLRIPTIRSEETSRSSEEVIRNY